VGAAQLDQAVDGDAERQDERVRLYRLAGQAADDHEYDEAGDDQDLEDVHAS